MSVLIHKGNTLNLSNDSDLRTKFVMALENDPLLDDKGELIDVDLSLFMLDGKGKVLNQQAIIFYNTSNQKSTCGSVVYDEGKLNINLDTIPQNVDRLAVAASVFEAENSGFTFKNIKNLTLSLFGKSNKKPFLMYHLTNEYHESSIILCEFFRFGQGWKLRAVGQGYHGGLPTLCNIYGLAAA